MKQEKAFTNFDNIFLVLISFQVTKRHGILMFLPAAHRLGHGLVSVKKEGRFIEALLHYLPGFKFKSYLQVLLAIVTCKFYLAVTEKYG